jgi:hypothetical protein
MIPTGSSRLPVPGLPPGGGAQIVSVEFVEPSPAESEFFSGGGGGEFRSPEGGEHLAN